MSFLNEISIYNAAADFRISTASTKQASLWTGLKNTANDLTLSNDTRLRALTALITSAELLEVAISFSYPSTTSPVNPIASGTVIHNDTVGLQGGTSTERYHSTFAQQTAWDNKASLSDITFANILGAVASNGALVAAFSAKQNLLSGNGLVRLAGSTLTYDNSVYLTNITGISSGGELQGTYPNPTLLNSAVIGKVLTGFSATNSAIVATDSIVAMAGKAQGQIDALSALAANSITALTGDISAAGPGSAAATISNNAVTFAKFQQIAQGFMGRSSVGTGTGVLLTPTQATALLNTFSSSLKGLVPASIVADGTKVLYDDGTWAVPPASGSGSVTNVSGAGIASLFSLSITNPSTTPALAFALINQSANRIFAGPTTGAAAAPTWRLLAASDIPELPISQISGLQGELDGCLPDALANGMLFIGNVSDVAVNAIVTGDLTATYVDNSGTNEAEFTIANEAVTYAKIQNVTSQTLLGRFALTDGVAQQLTLNGSDFTINSSTGVIGLVTPNSPILTTKGDILTHTGAAQARLGIGANATFFMADTAATTGNKWVAMSGDATIAVSGALTIAAGAVTLAKMANMATNSFIGRISASTGVPEILTATQATSLLNLFSSSAKGLVPAASGGLDATYFLNATGAWSVPAGGGGSGTVTSIATAGLISGGTITTTGTITTSMATNKLVGRGTAGTGIMEEITLGTGLSLTGTTLNATGGGSGTVTSVDLTMPTAFSVTGNPITTSGTLAVTGAGTVSQYIRGDGTLGIFPSIGGGGGGSVYYLNGGVTASPSTIGGVAMYQLSKAPATAGASVNFSANTNGAVIASFLTDTGDPNQTSIPAGIWIFECYLSAAGGGSAHPTVEAVVEKWDGTALSVIATGVAEEITNGTTKDLYQFAVTIPTGTNISLSDRIVVQIKVVAAASKTITLYTQNGNVSSVTTTFPNGIVSLNSLTAGTQLFANGSTGTAPAFVSSTATHTLNIPFASASSVTAGLISKTEYDTFNGKMSNPMTAVGDIIYGGTVVGGIAPPTRLAGQTTNGIYLLRANVIASAAVAPDWLGSTGSGNVVLATSPTLTTSLVTGSTTFALLNTTATTINFGGAATTMNIGGTGAAINLGGGAAAAELRFLEPSGSGTDYTAFKAVAQAASLTYSWPATAPTAGQVLSAGAISGGVYPLSWATGGSGSSALSAITAAAQTNTIANTLWAQVWNWDTLTTQTALTLGSTSATSGKLLQLSVTGSSATTGNILDIINSSTGNTTGRGLNIAISGATNSGNTIAAAFANTKTGSASTNTALQLTSSGGTTNYSLDIVSGILRVGVGTTSFPQIVLTASAGIVLPGTTNGSLIYDTVSSNSSISLYKDSAYTKLITAARNPDFATAATTGVIVADSNGTLTKSADLTALGIFAQTSTITVANTATSTTLLGTLTGSATLPASFFGTGKTIKIFVSGTYNQASGSQDCALKLTIGGVTAGTITFTHNAGLTTVYYDAEFTLTCRTTGASGTLQYLGVGRLNHTGTDLKNYVQVSTTSGAINTTGTLAIDVQADWVTADPANSITASIITATYLN